MTPKSRAAVKCIKRHIKEGEIEVIPFLMYPDWAFYRVGHNYLVDTRNIVSFGPNNDYTAVYRTSVPGVLRWFGGLTAHKIRRIMEKAGYPMAPKEVKPPKVKLPKTPKLPKPPKVDHFAWLKDC